jgi:hypothetical protein
MENTNSTASRPGLKMVVVLMIPITLYFLLTKAFPRLALGCLVIPLAITETILRSSDHKTASQ